VSGDVASPDQPDGLRPDVLYRLDGDRLVLAGADSPHGDRHG